MSEIKISFEIIKIICLSLFFSTIMTFICFFSYCMFFIQDLKELKKFLARKLKSILIMFLGFLLGFLLIAIEIYLEIR